MIRQSIRSNSHGKRTPIRDRGFQCGWAVLIDSSAVLRPLSSLRFVDVPRDGLPRAFAIGPSAPASSRGATNGRSDLARGAYGIRRASSIRARGAWRAACGVSRVACRMWHVACGMWRVACVAACRFVRPRPDRSRAGEPRRAWMQSAPCAMRALDRRRRCRRDNPYQVMSQFGGADATKPHLLAAYSVRAAPAGTIAGVAALSCN